MICSKCGINVDHESRAEFRSGILCWNCYIAGKKPKVKTDDKSF